MPSVNMTSPINDSLGREDAYGGYNGNHCDPLIDHSNPVILDQDSYRPLEI